MRPSTFVTIAATRGQCLNPRAARHAYGAARAPIARRWWKPFGKLKGVRNELEAYTLINLESGSRLNERSRHGTPSRTSALGELYPQYRERYFVKRA